MSNDLEVRGESARGTHLIDDLDTTDDPRFWPEGVDLTALDDLEDSGAMWSLPHGGDLDAKVVRIRRGGELAGHVIGEVDVLIAVWSGAGELLIDDHATALRSGVVVRVPRGARRAIRVDDHELTYLSIHRRRESLNVSLSD